MAQPTITVIIENGQSTVSTEGFQGKACMDATAELEKALGVTVSDRRTPEYDLKEVQQAGR